MHLNGARLHLISEEHAQPNNLQWLWRTLTSLPHLALSRMLQMTSFELTSHRTKRPIYRDTFFGIHSKIISSVCQHKPEVPNVLLPDLLKYFCTLLLLNKCAMSILNCSVRYLWLLSSSAHIMSNIWFNKITVTGHCCCIKKIYE